MPHSIRLRGPWNYEPLARFLPRADGRVNVTKDDLPPSGVVELPGDWASVLGAEFQGRVRFTRRFHRPTGLHAASRVFLVIDDVDWEAEVSLNDCPLGTVVCSQSAAPQQASKCPARFDVTSQLSPQNRLSITVTSPTLDVRKSPSLRPGRTGQPGGPIGLIRLEID